MPDFLSISGLVAGVITVVVGILLLVWPRFVAAIIGIYLIIVGIIAIISAL